MALFDAGDVVEVVGYDFTKYGGSAGVIPEPMSPQIRRFWRYMQSTSGIDAQDKNAVAAFAKSIAAKTDDEIEAMDDEFHTVLAALCSDQPSAAEIKLLPARIFRAFFGYVYGYFLDPTLSIADMRPSPGASTVDGHGFSSRPV